jgi:hypothetical protein
MQYKYLGNERMKEVDSTPIEVVERDFEKARKMFQEAKENPGKANLSSDEIDYYEKAEVEFASYLEKRKIKEAVVGQIKDNFKKQNDLIKKAEEASTDKNAELAKAAEEAEANSGTTPVDASTAGAGDEGWWSWLKPDDFFKALDPTRPPVTFQSILKFLVLINFVGGGFLAMYELNVKGFSAIDFQLVFISIFIGMYGYAIYKL